MHPLAGDWRGGEAEEENSVDHESQTVDILILIYRLSFIHVLWSILKVYVKRKTNKLLGKLVFLVEAEENP